MQLDALWQTLLAEQVWPPVHVPQLRVPPQPSLMLPQFLPCAAQVVGVQLELQLEMSCHAVDPQVALSGAIELQNTPAVPQPDGSPFTPEACEMHLYSLPL